MPTGADVVLLDTSAAVPWLVQDHEQHRSVTAALRDRTLGLAGHAAFETLSVLTRLPGSLRVTPAVAAELLRRGFPATRHLSARRAAALLPELGRLRVSGGSVYDALVAATAAEHGLVLATRDRKALPTYEAVGAQVLLV